MPPCSFQFASFPVFAFVLALLFPTFDLEYRKKLTRRLGICLTVVHGRIWATKVNFSAL